MLGEYVDREGRIEAYMYHDMQQFDPTLNYFRCGDWLSMMKQGEAAEAESMMFDGASHAADGCTSVRANASRGSGALHVALVRLIHR